MTFDADFIDITVKLVASLITGLIIGAEREYRNKSAGLRTIILISLGSTIFTIISIASAHPTEIGRIASNIVTGIGFLGAGAIMRDGFTISGLTTASTIWVTAALGMAIGVGEFEMTLMALVLVMTVLVIFSYFQKALDRVHKEMQLTIVFDIDRNGVLHLENEMKKLRMSFDRIRESRKEGDVQYQYKIAGNEKSLDKLVEYLVQQKELVKSFEY
ncbi:MAG TPA: MgtC/SapB family protein [Chryseosolibacter sp.]|nr:MgtC/SapB family protein [Chryseosolibacter sp.]